MASKDQKAEGAANVAEAIQTPEQPVPVEDVSAPTGKAKTEPTEAQKAEGAANVAEAKASEAQHKTDAAGQSGLPSIMADNRRISALLASQRAEAKPVQVRRLQNQVKRLQAQLAGASSPVSSGTPKPPAGSPII